ncbi:MAG: Lacal_2735 family protein [Gelidibacter sp.]
MNQHFCKVGKIRFGLNEVINLKEIEKNYLKFSEEAYNLMQTDSSLSDFLYEEANKLKKLILSLKTASTNDVDAAF